MAAPQNIRTTKADIDGLVVRIAWDDPNTDTQRVRFWTVDSNGTPTATEVIPTMDTAGRWAFLRAGTYAISAKATWGGESSKAVFTTDEATEPAPPAPPELTAEQHLEAALGVELTVGDRVAIYPEPSTVVTVQADGSLG